MLATGNYFSYRTGMRYWLIIPLLCSPLWTSAKTISLHPEMEWFSVLYGDGLKPGDEVILAPGVYSHPRKLDLSHRGTAAQPIIIRGPARSKHGPTARIQRPDQRQNTFNLIGTQYLELRDLEITGGSAAIRISGSGKHLATNVTLRNLHIHHIGGVAVTCNHDGNEYEGMHFIGNEIHHTRGHGEGFYLGGNNASAIFHHGIIEQNYIHDLTGSDISQGDGIELKHGSYGNIVRDNIIVRTKYPGIIVYGTRGKAPNVLERNLIYQTGDHGIQAAADAIIRNNVILEAGGNGIHCRSHQQADPGGLVLIHNTIIQRANAPAGIRIVPAAKGLTSGVKVINNALHPLQLRLPTGPLLHEANNVVLPSPRPLPPPTAMIEKSNVLTRDFFGIAREQGLVPGACLPRENAPQSVRQFVQDVRSRQAGK